jgi:hypothetical protein
MVVSNGEIAMHPGTTDASAGLMMNFLDWVGQQPRTYGETMDAWRTSCPRISVWEDASLEGLVALTQDSCGVQNAVGVILTQAGADHLAGRRRPEG